MQQVARNKAIDMYRRKVRVPLLPLEYADGMIDQDLTPEQLSIQREGFEHLYQVIAQLPLLEQQIIHLRFGNGLRFAQIASILDKRECSIEGKCDDVMNGCHASAKEEYNRSNWFAIKQAKIKTQ